MRQGIKTRCYWRTQIQKGLLDGNFQARHWWLPCPMSRLQTWLQITCRVSDRGLLAYEGNWPSLNQEGYSQVLMGDALTGNTYFKRYVLRTTSLSPKSPLLFRYLLTETSSSPLTLEFYWSAFMFSRNMWARIIHKSMKRCWCRYAEYRKHMSKHLPDMLLKLK